MKKLYTKHGLTLIELLIVMAVFTIIAGAMMRILISGGAAWHVGEAQAELIKQARRGMSSMVRELQHSSSSDSPSLWITTPPANGLFYNSMTFKRPWDTDADGDVINAYGSIAANELIQIQYSRGGTNNRQLLRTLGGVSTVIANDVTNLTFRRMALTPDLVEITLNVQRTTMEGRVLQFTLSDKVDLRN